jgi:anthranilate synthase/aminodeoxychorismate synthase-like glutamine amidotransferase
VRQRVFVCDNYDSFTFNLVQHLGSLGARVDVARNDEFSFSDLDPPPDAVVISPGPKGPAEAGLSVPLVEWCAHSATPLLGVCLGHQAIAVASGGRVVRAPAVMHGKTSEVHHAHAGVLAGLPDPFDAMRYHSLVVEASSIPDDLEVTAWTDDGTVMGLRHRRLPIEGVQFHPESILTVVGITILGNFLRADDRRAAVR